MPYPDKERVGTLPVHQTPSHSCSPSARRFCRSTTGLHLRCHHVPSEAVATASDLVVVANPAIVQVAIQATVDLILLSPIQIAVREPSMEASGLPRSDHHASTDRHDDHGGRIDSRRHHQRHHRCSCAAGSGSPSEDGEEGSGRSRQEAMASGARTSHLFLI
nr:PREDICTED: uncharacterized protein LOC108952948 [Musa acuminata subsp. malaccensis]